jgi:thiol-disulfide isomerase/thioredoxin
MKKVLALIFLTISLFGADHKMVATDMNGKKIHITGTKSGFTVDEHKGKIIFLEFFGHMCPPCMASIPHYKKLTEKYKDKLAMIAIEAQGYNDSQLKDFAKEKGINYTLMSSDGAGEFYQYVSGRAGWRGAIPFLVVTDMQGNVKFVKPGYVDESELETLIQKFSN